jgi:hypothetical protein
MGHEHGYHAGIEGCMFAPPNFQLKNSKDHPFDVPQQINRGHQNLWDDPIFVGDILSRGGCFDLQLSSESFCKAPSFHVWKTWVVSLTVFVIVLCLGFALGLGFCSWVEVKKICGKLSWIGYWGFRLGFRSKAYRGWSTSPDSVPTSFFYSQLLRSGGGKESLYIGLHLWKWSIITSWFLLRLLSANVWVLQHVKGCFMFKILLNKNFVIKCLHLDLWKDDAKFRYLYNTDPERYLSGASNDALEEVP